MSQPMFEKIALIGIGLIGGSIALEARKRGLAKSIVAATRSAETAATANRLKLADHVVPTSAEAARDADLVIVCTPVGACGPAAEGDRRLAQAGCIVSDVGLGQAGGDRRHGAAPSAGRAFRACPSGRRHRVLRPRAAILDLFEGRCCILTPLPAVDPAAVDKLEAFWKALGSEVNRIDPADHDRILAITSHLPHLIAYTIVGTADDLGGHLNSEVLKYRRRRLPRLHPHRRLRSDDVARRVHEQPRAVLEVLQRFQEDLFYLQRAIRWGEGDKLFDLFTRTARDPPRADPSPSGVSPLAGPRASGPLLTHEAGREAAVRQDLEAPLGRSPTAR
jgi:cyclohexadieny/prephenate dehydrogenase